jgi:hypothetical protein
MSGGFAVIDGGSLQLTEGAGSIDFAAGTGANWGTLDLTGLGSGSTFSSNFTAQISGFTGTGGTSATSDVIDVTGSGADHVVWTQNGASGTLQVEDASDDVLEKMTLDGTYEQSKFVLTDPASVDQITYENPPCYCRGTRILTNRGEVAVEKLAVGDVVINASDERRPIRWIGHRALVCRRHRDPRDIFPVRVSAGAFGERQPSRDLWLSPGHCVAVDGALIPIRFLINGLSVAQVETEKVEYWHVELDEHDVVIAEGLPAESYLDCGNRTAFVNGGAFINAHPDFEPKAWRDTCLPLVKDGPEVANAKSRLFARLFNRGYHLTDDADPYILASGRRIKPIRFSERMIAFAIPRGCKSLTLKSNTFIPAHAQVESDDERELGLGVARLEINGADIALDDDAFSAAGWHGAERPGGRFRQRWTRGVAQVPVGARNVRIVLIVLADPGYYWREPSPAPIAQAA